MGRYLPSISKEGLGGAAAEVECENKTIVPVKTLLYCGNSRTEECDRISMAVKVVYILFVPEGVATVSWCDFSNSSDNNGCGCHRLDRSLLGDKKYHVTQLVDEVISAWGLIQEGRARIKDGKSH
jgi:hypothetical protein